MRTWPLNKEGRKIVYFGERMRLWLLIKYPLANMHRKFIKGADKDILLYYEYGGKK